MTKEQQFYKALADVFIGAKVEGQSGYINLMRIKSSYYEKYVFPKLKEDIEKVLKEFPGFRDELFEKPYDFFHRYFSESGSIYFQYTPLKHNIYEKIYTDDKDVMLFWKTHMLYYVKTDRIFNSMPVEFDGWKFFFDVSKLEHKKANEKKELIFELKEVKADGTIVFFVYYSEKGKITKIDEILKSLKKKSVKADDGILERAFRTFEKQAEVDYFINKNAKKFLTEQFNMWFYQYIFSGESKWSEQRIKQLQDLREIIFKIIDFISQFEDELVKIWDKPKFVRNSNYVITLDRIHDKKLIEKIKKHKNFSEQVKEWKELGIGKNNPKAPLDTKYFKDLELEILSKFDDLDKSLDGWLIKSENYQALNTILPKFKEKVQTIYIDPPFNKETDADYLYYVKYKDAIWASLLENRLWLGKNFLDKKGSIFVRCDYNGNWIVRSLMNEIFGTENFRNELSVQRSLQTRKAEKKFLDKVDSLFFYFKFADEGSLEILSREKDYIKAFRNTLKILKKLIKDETYKEIKDKLLETIWMPFLSMPGEQKSNTYREVFGIKLYPPKGRHWAFSQENLNIAIEKGLARLRCYKCDKIILQKTGFIAKCPNCNNTSFRGEIYSMYNQINSNWTDIPGYEQDPDFPTKNAEVLLARVIESTSRNGDMVLDYFLGSGTTTAVAHKLNRRWIGVEMAEHFTNKALPEMKRVLAYDKSGISKEVKEYQGGGFFKYYELEQYEDVLKNVKYDESDLFSAPNEDVYNQYIFMRDLKLLDALKIDSKKKEVKVDLTKLYPGIDIAETLSNLLGKWIKKITNDYVEFEDGLRINTKNLDWKLLKPLIWW